MESPRQGGADDEEAMTITTVIANRVRTLRGGVRLSGTGLANAMRELGVPWTQTTVAKLETGKRESVTVQELLALAVVLGVPFVWLLADPTSTEVVRITEGIDAEPWSALLWATGNRPLSRPTSASWDRAESALTNVAEVSSLLTWLSRDRTLVSRGLADYDPGLDDGTDTLLLRRLRDRLRQLTEAGFIAPGLPEFATQRAAELGVDMTGEG